jgi:hypothetical protein
MGFDQATRAVMSDTMLIIQKSLPAFQTLINLLSKATEFELLDSLRGVKKLISAMTVGDILLLPALVEGGEIILLIEKTSARQSRVVIVQTNPDTGLRYHASSATLAMPLFQYRTCMVLNDVSNKNINDDVFWLALYNMSIHKHAGDVDKFYDILIPFLTDKPLEFNLVEAEVSAGTMEAPEALNAFKAAKPPTSARDAVKNMFQTCGQWKSPQLSPTAYVRSLTEVLHYLLRLKGLDEGRADQVSSHLRLRVA